MSGGYQIPQDAEKRIPSEFWKPEKPGDTLIGKVERFGKNSLGDNATLSPCVVWPIAGEPSGFGSMAVGLNSSLAKQLDETLRGKPIAIKYLGKKGTPQGAMRLYGVAVLPVEEWARLSEQFKLGIVERMSAGPGAPGVEQPAPDEDVIPF